MAVEGFGTVLTAPTQNGNDCLVRLAAPAFAGTVIGTDTGAGAIWGLASVRGRLLGFTNAGQLVTIDPATGAGTGVQSGGPVWYGAAVATNAPSG